MIDLHGFGHLLIDGVAVTIKVWLTSLFFGMLFGLSGAAARLSSIKVIRAIATIYTTVFRGIPELLLILFLYFGSSVFLSQVLPMLGYDKYVDVSSFWAGVVALSLAFGAYATEIFRMAIQEVPKGQSEAAKAIGMKPLQTFFRITLPQVWKLALPGLGNLCLVLVKDTALLSVIGSKDLMYYSGRAAQTTQEAFTFYMAAAIIYLMLTVIITGTMMVLEWLADPAARYTKTLERMDMQALNNTNKSV